MPQFFEVNKTFITVVKTKAAQMIPETSRDDLNTPLAEAIGVKLGAAHGILFDKLEEQFFLAESDFIGHPRPAFGLRRYRARLKKSRLDLVECGSANTERFTGLGDTFSLGIN